MSKEKNKFRKRKKQAEREGKLHYEGGTPYEIQKRKKRLERKLYLKESYKGNISKLEKDLKLVKEDLERSKDRIKEAREKGNKSDLKESQKLKESAENALEELKEIKKDIEKSK